MQSLDTELSRSKGIVFWGLLKRSGWAILIVVAVILLIALFPDGESPSTTRPGQVTYNDARKLKHVLLLHRHGALLAYPRVPLLLCERAWSRVYLSVCPNTVSRCKLAAFSGSW
jgi:hypothetical protein